MPSPIPEPLPHNPRNAVTYSIERSTYQGQRAIRKVLNGNNHADTPVEWLASTDPSHWNYWQREAHFYGDEIGQCLDGSGVRLARTLAVSEHADNKIELILEDVQGRTGTQLMHNDYVDLARCWGKAQAQLIAADFSASWTSKNFLASYARSKPVDYGLVEIGSASPLNANEAWQRPLILDNWPSNLGEKLRKLVTSADELFALVQRAPRAPCHLDWWPNNLIIDREGKVVPVDWSFFGDGAVGEDIANFVADAVFDGFMPADQLPSMADLMIEAYADGLADGSYACDERQLRATIAACGVKYIWLGPVLLQRAGDSQQFLYGGNALADANEQYRERGAALSFLCDWAERALDDNVPMQFRR